MGRCSEVEGLALWIGPDNKSHLPTIQRLPLGAVRLVGENSEYGDSSVSPTPMWFASGRRMTGSSGYFLVSILPTYSLSSQLLQSRARSAPKPTIAMHPPLFVDKSSIS